MALCTKLHISSGHPLGGTYILFSISLLILLQYSAAKNINRGTVHRLKCDLKLLKMNTPTL